MKTLSITIKTLTIFILAGALFFSCDVAEPDANGTLVIDLTESNSAQAISKYHILCHNEDNEISQDFNGSTSISLSPGTWSVILTALDSNGEGIGYGGDDVSITAGENKTLTMKLYLWTHFSSIKNEIRNFKIPYNMKAVYVTSDKDEANKDNSLLQNKYGMRVFNNQTFKEFFAVILKCDDDSTGSDYTYLTDFAGEIGIELNNALDEYKVPIENAKQVGSQNDKILDLYTGKDNYIIITYREW